VDLSHRDNGLTKAELQPSQAKMMLKLEYGPMSNVMAAQPNIGGALCESSVIPFLIPRRKVWLTPTAPLPCSNAANIGERKTWTQ